MRQDFKGYYFKCIDGEQAAAFIPALHKRSASLQIITKDQAYVVPYSKIRFDSRRFSIRIGKNTFCRRGILLNIKTKDCIVQGRLSFGKFQKLKYPIMGPFRLIPCMQCRHSIISMNHSVTGKLRINNSVYSFENGKGYIEGDSGRSFPKKYIWTQCHYEGGSLMLAAADIPFLGAHFMGVIAVVRTQKKEYRIATYLGARVVSAAGNSVTVKQGQYTLTARLIETNHQKLNTPVKGEMIRTIHESVACKASYKFTHGSRTIFNFVSENASFEYEMPRATGS